MAERLVDVLDSNRRVLHTYPIMPDQAEGTASDAEYQTKALEPAAPGQLVPDADLAGLSAQLHRSRGGRMQPYGDEISTMSETKLALEQAVRKRAYALWEEEGRPRGARG